MPAARNLLGSEASPYLLQHAGQPVHWRPWGESALREARDAGRPILLSIGYAACHWCHVMARESFADEATARLINRHFVAIKVDREERPDIDQFGVAALRALDLRPGWPLTVFLTPRGEPFWGGTYFPPEPRAGRPSFRQVLERVASTVAEQPDKVARIAEVAGRSLAEDAAPRSGDPPRGPALDRLVARILHRLDPEHGGLAGAPKFPHAPLFRFLWQDGFRTGDAAGADALLALLRGMIGGGIHDHLGGGFARYAVDAAWHVPHFEKMLGDNGQILELLALAHAARPERDLAASAERLVGWLLREMRVGDAFASSQAAETEGEEGRFYTWDAADIDAILGARAAAFKAAYGVTPDGNWEGRNVLRRAGGPRQDDALVRLFAHRASRLAPSRDDKVLADWNALAILGLVRAAAVFGRPDWLAAARAAFRFLLEHLGTKDGRIAHAWLGRVSANGLLEDQAAMGRAALALFEATGEDAYLARAIDLAHATKRWFARPDGGYSTQARDAADTPADLPAQLEDHATPSGHGQLAELFARLFHLTGDDGWRVDAETLIRSLAGRHESLVGMPSLLAAADVLERGGTLVVASYDGPPAERMLEIARAVADPALCLLGVADGAALPPGHPAHGKEAPRDGAAAYLCRGGSCGLPVLSAEALRDLLHPTFVPASSPLRRTA